jgi:hypothetical protein
MTTKCISKIVWPVLPELPISDQEGNAIHGVFVPPSMADSTLLLAVRALDYLSVAFEVCWYFHGEILVVMGLVVFHHFGDTDG